MDQTVMEQTWEFQRIVKAEEQGSYPEIPFELPENAQLLHVSYAYESLGVGPCIIDLGVHDGERVRGWSGGARTEFFIGEAEATPGYLPGRLAAGSWAVLLGAYRVPAAGCLVTVKVKAAVRQADGLWLLGELHSHTVHSDGAYTLDEAVAIMKDAGCDFLATTDHNTVSQNVAHPQGSGLVLIPGMELTTYFGHCNFLGAVDPVRDFRVAGVSDVAERMREAKRSGALRILNHPFCDHCPWEWGMDAEAEAVEIWNGPWRPLNQRALDWWQEQLAAGRRPPAVGGSDVHRPDRYVKHACPSTWVYATARTIEAILEGIAAGKAYMSFAPYGPVLQLQCGLFGIGDTVPAGVAGGTAESAAGGETVVSVRMERLLPGDDIRFVTEKGPADEWTVEGGDGNGTWSISWAAGDARFVRVEAWRYFPEAGDKCPVLISNPIYFER